MLIRFLLCSVISYAVYGCGVLPAGQSSSVRFNVTGFKLPPRMAYTDQSHVSSQVPSISRSIDEANKFVEYLIMRSIEDVLKQQGRNALLPDYVISAILQQLNINLDNYEPLRCNKVFTQAPMVQQDMFDMDKQQNCYIIGNTVTNLCLMGMMAGGGVRGVLCKVENVPPKYMSISGIIRTTNIIMANWSTSMWQSVLNRVAQSLSSGPLGENFVGVSISAQR